MGEVAGGEMPTDILLRDGTNPLDYSATDPGPPRAPITKWLWARLGQVQEAGGGWHAVMSRPVTRAKKQPLKAQRDKLRKSHPREKGWDFRVLTEWNGDDAYHTLWAHYDPSRSSGAHTVPGDRAQANPQARPVAGGPAPSQRRLAPPPAPPQPPHSQALRPGPMPPVPDGGLVGMEWANEPDEMPTREVPE